MVRTHWTTVHDRGMCIDIGSDMGRYGYPTEALFHEKSCHNVCIDTKTRLTFLSIGLAIIQHAHHASPATYALQRPAKRGGHAETGPPCPGLAPNVSNWKWPAIFKLRRYSMARHALAKAFSLSPAPRFSPSARRLRRHGRLF